MRSRSPRIVVIRSGAIGDTLMATPLLRSLRTSFANAYIGVVASAKAADVLRFNPHVDEVFSLRGRHLPFLLSLEKRRLARRLYDMGLDAVLSLESGSSFSDLARRFGGKQLITYDRSAGSGAKIISPLADEHSIETHLRAGAAAGARGGGPEMELHYPPELDREVEERLAEFSISSTDRIVGIHAGWGSRQHDPDDTRLRSWPASKFADAMRRIAERSNVKFVLTGGKLDRELNREIIERAGVDAVETAGRFSLLTSAALIRRMSVYLTIDSGPAHMAAALGTPLVTLWGPGIFTATRPVGGDGKINIIRVQPPCAPCYGTPLMKTCINNLCMKQIRPDAVAESVLEMLSRNK